MAVIFKAWEGSRNTPRTKPPLWGSVYVPGLRCYINCVCYQGGSRENGGALDFGKFPLIFGVGLRIFMHFLDFW